MRKVKGDRCSDYIFLVDPLHVILLVVKFALDLTMVLLALKNVAKVNSYRGDLADLAAMNCSDSMVNDSLNETSTNISKIVYKLDVITTVLMLIYFIISLIAVTLYVKNQIAMRRKILQAKFDASNLNNLNEAE